jgi:putative alpha-1,2-mannosidase
VLRATSLKAALCYSTKTDERILIKTGISGADTLAAITNLDAEIPGWVFNGVRQAAVESWARELARIQVIGGTSKQREIF